MPANAQLRRARELRGWSQARVAQEIGVDTHTIHRWERGQAFPFPYYREKLSALFGMSIAQLGLLRAQQAPKPLPPSPASGNTFVDPLIPLSATNRGTLVGRDKLLQQLKTQLRAGKSVVLTALHGLPGVGKTALALALITDPQIQAHFADGILWAGLGPEPDILGQFSRWGTLLGIRAEEMTDRSKQAWKLAITTHIGQRRMLLVVDDVWKAEDALAFQMGGPRCASIMTTRFPQLAHLVGTSQPIAVEELSESEGLHLLARFVPELVEQELQQARELVHSVGGLPLALTLMGRYLAMQAHTGQPRRLRTALTRLQETQQRLSLSLPTSLVEHPPNLPEGVSLSLHAAIAISEQCVSAQAQHVLRALALFPAKPNNFSEEAALAVSGESEEALDALWDAGLLESSGPGRYTLHQTIADYARLQGALPGAQARFVDSLVGYVQAHTQDYEALEPETANILAALELALSLGMQQQVLQGVLAFFAFLRVRGFYAQADHWLQQALTAATNLQEERARLTILRHLAAIAEARGEYTQATQYGKQGLALARTLGEVGMQCALFITLGRVAYNLGDLQQAQAYSEEGLHLARESGDTVSIMTLLTALGGDLRDQGHVHQAEACLQEGLALARQQGYQEQLARLLHSLGTVTLEQGHYTQANQYLLEGLAVARQLGHRELTARLLNALGITAGQYGQFEQAIASFQEGLAQVRQIGHRDLICTLLGNLGYTAEAQGNYAQSERYYQEGLSLAREMGNRYLVMELVSNLGHVMGLQGDYASANVYFQEGVELARSAHSLRKLKQSLAEWGEIHLQHQQVDAARAALEEVLHLDASSESDPEVVALAHYGLARVAELSGDVATAWHLGQQSLAELEAIRHHRASDIKQWLVKLSE